MIQKIYLTEGSRLFFGDTPAAREHKIVCKDGVFLGRADDQIALGVGDKVKQIPLSELGFDEDGEGIFFEV